jgi:hypothetical protein
MGKCALILGLILLSGSAVFARCYDCCDRCDCYYYPPPPRPVIVGGYRYRTYYPTAGININFSSRHHHHHRPVPRGHGGHGSPRIGASIHVGI